MEFTLDAFREQMSRIRRLGSLQEIMGRIPPTAQITLAFH